jgi:hypothetical protein
MVIVALLVITALWALPIQSRVQAVHIYRLLVMTM